jgi:hypothetical protein
MALSLRYYSPEIKIHLLHDGQIESGLFDSSDVLDHGICYTAGRVNPSLAKMHVYDYTPFDETVYLDIDGIAVRDVEPLFEIKGDFKTQYVGDTQADMLWATHDQFREHFDISSDVPIHGVNSSFQLMRRNKRTDKFIKTAQRLFANPIPLHELNLKWGTAQPDELYLVGAIAKTGMDADAGIKPVYFRTRHQAGAVDSLETIRAKHFIIGCWGGRLQNHNSVEAYYDRLTNNHSKKILGRSQDFKFHRLIDDKFLLTK